MDLWAITIGLLGGLAFFLYGIDMMSGSLKAIAGDGLRKLLGDLTKNRLLAATSGAVVTAVVQSSSVTTVLVVGFISAGLMSLTQSVGVIMGANIGSTVTAQLVAFKVTDYALLPVILGFAILFISKKKKVKQVGATIMGLGLLFFGMGLMSEATEPLREYQPFIDMMKRMEKPLFGILIGLAFTALVQSSAATTGIAIVLATEGFITLPAGIALAFGANIGTCVTALLAALGKPTEAKRAAVVHVLFNIIGVLIWLPFIDHLADWVREISPSHPELKGEPRMAAEVPRQIANAHTVFNVANTVIFIWFDRVFAWLARRIVREKPIPLPEAAQPQFLDPVYLDTPSLAVDRVILEAGHLGNLTQDVIAALGGSDSKHRGPNLERIEERAADVEILTREIFDYAQRLTQENLSGSDGHRLQTSLTIVNHLRDISDTASLNLANLTREWQAEHLQPSESTVAIIDRTYASLEQALRLAVESCGPEPDLKKAQQVIDMKAAFGTQIDELAQHLGKRLLSDAPNRARLYQLESRVLEIMRRLYYFAKRIAKTVVNEGPDHEALMTEKEK